MVPIQRLAMRVVFGNGDGFIMIIFLTTFRLQITSLKRNDVRVKVAEFRIHSTDDRHLSIIRSPAHADLSSSSKSRASDLITTVMLCTHFFLYIIYLYRRDVQSFLIILITIFFRPNGFVI